MEQQTVSDLYLSPGARSLLDQVVTQPERQTLPDSLAKSPSGTGENKRKQPDWSIRQKTFIYQSFILNEL